MANTSDFMFDKITRIGNDCCSIDQTMIENVDACNYMTQNYFNTECTMKNAKALATSQPGVNYSGSFGMGIGGCNVDNSSRLLLGGVQTNPKCRIDLFARPFATVPYMGRGSVNPDVESNMMQGEQNTSRRSITHQTEKSYLKYHNTPLIPTKKATVQNPENLVEGIAHDGWVRGGISSRELTRDINYSSNHTANQYP